MEVPSLQRSSSTSDSIRCQCSTVEPSLNGFTDLSMLTTDIIYCYLVITRCRQWQYAEVPCNYHWLTINHKYLAVAFIGGHLHSLFIIEISVWLECTLHDTESSSYLLITHQFWARVDVCTNLEGPQYCYLYAPKFQNFSARGTLWIL